MIKKVLAGLFIMASVSACNATENSEPDFVVGVIEQNQLMQDFPLFSRGYSSAMSSEEQNALVAKWPKDLHIDVYFGTWCHDSQREVPKFLKLMSENPAVSYRLVSLDYEKSDPSGLSANDDVKYTPTFVVKKSGNEIGRIVENTKENYAKDITNML